MNYSMVQGYVSVGKVLAQACRLEFNLQNSHKKLGVAMSSCNPSKRRQRQADPGFRDWPVWLISELQIQWETLPQKIGWKEQRKPLRSANAWVHTQRRWSFRPPDPSHPSPQHFLLVFHKEAESDSSDRVLRTPSLRTVVVTPVGDGQSTDSICNMFTLLCPLGGFLDNYLALFQDWV